MKKLIIVVASLIMAISLTACGSSYNEGTYEGEGQGYNQTDKIKVKVTVDADGKISAVDVVSHNETEEIGGAALDTVKAQAVEKNSAEVDNITGATMTVDGFKQAMNAALETAK